MVVYILFYIFIFFSAILSFKNIEKKIAVNLFYFTSFLFFIFIGFRSCGYDLLVYFDIYDTIKSGDDALGIEPGFSFFCTISPNFRFLLLLVAFTTIFLHSKYIFKYSTQPLLSLLIISGTILLPTFMGQMRQGIAIGLIAFTFNYLNQKKYHLYFLFLILGVLFHFSAIVAIIFVLVPKKIQKLNYYIITIVISIFIFQFLQLYVLKFLNLFPDFVYFEKILSYSESDDEKVGLNTAILIRIFVLFLGYANREKINKSYFPQMLNVYHLSIVFYLIFGQIIPQLSTRGTLYLSYFDIVLIPLIISEMVGYKKIIIVAIFVLLTFFRIFKFLNEDISNDSVYIPYTLYNSFF